MHLSLSTSGIKPRSVWKLAGCVLLLVALGAHAQPPSITLPGRKPDSQEPWGAFLGQAAHFVIGRQYILENPRSRVFLNNIRLSTIMEQGALGDPERLSEFVKALRPDITDTTKLVLFEIKPDTAEGLREGREQAGNYLQALNEAVEPLKRLSGGTGYEGSLFLDFETGGALWRLTWRTPEPGVTLYRWSYRRKGAGGSWKERVEQKEEELPRQEVELRGELAEGALRAAYGEGEFPDAFQGRVYRPVDCR